MQLQKLDVTAGIGCVPRASKKDHFQPFNPKFISEIHQIPVLDACDAVIAVSLNDPLRRDSPIAFVK